jgi:membrane protein implicated in regulation of membrane protease activity
MGIRSEMSSRFISNVSIQLTGTLLVVFAFAFRGQILEWFGLGAGCAAVVVTLAAFAVRDRGAFKRFLDAGLALIGGWMIVAACVFSGAALRWLSFAEGAALAALCTIALCAYEIAVRRRLRQSAAERADFALTGLQHRLPDHPGRVAS